ncbi:hypothetical protein ANK1_1543 [plant metagenome]|uniref:Uncharacterized protein n=1 Tax=plant metagenome TaxID=1297885 RepID=A0A484QA34_9ZZZZ
MKKRQKSNPQFYHPPPSSPDAQNQCAKINLKAPDLPKPRHPGKMRPFCRRAAPRQKAPPRGAASRRRGVGVPLREPQAHVTGWRHSSVAATFAANPPRLAPAAAS